MPAERFEFRVPIAKLLIALLFTVVPICVAGLYSLSQSQQSLEKMAGLHFRVIAQSGAAEVSQFVHDRVAGIGTLAAEPLLVQTVSAADRAYSGASDAAVSARLNRAEKDWNTPASVPVVQAILSSPASRHLRRYREIDRRFLRLTVTDAKGAVVAATHKTLDYIQSDEDFWQAVYADGRGSINLTDILYDGVTKSHYIGIGMPILEEGSNRFLGMVDALLEVSSIFPIVNRPQAGGTFRMSIVKEDGTVISAPQTNLAMNLKSEEYAAVREALATLQGRQRGYTVAALRNDESRLIGFADTGLKKDYGNLGWYVLISQEMREAFAPVRMVGRMLALMALLGLVAVVFLSVYFSLHRQRVLTGIGEAQQPKATAA